LTTISPRSRRGKKASWKIVAAVEIEIAELQIQMAFAQDAEYQMTSHVKRSIKQFEWGRNCSSSARIRQTSFKGNANEHNQWAKERERRKKNKLYHRLRSPPGRPIIYFSVSALCCRAAVAELDACNVSHSQLPAHNWVGPNWATYFYSDAIWAKALHL
jgi:hypothetical protein